MFWPPSIWYSVMAAQHTNTTPNRISLSPPPGRNNKRVAFGNICVVKLFINILTPRERTFQSSRMSCCLFKTQMATLACYAKLKFFFNHLQVGILSIFIPYWDSPPALLFPFLIFSFLLTLSFFLLSLLSLLTLPLSPVSLSLIFPVLSPLSCYMFSPPYFTFPCKNSFLKGQIFNLFLP